MFRQKPRKQLIVRLIDGEGAVILECSCDHLPIKEKVILEKSVEFFNDPEPCFIHRSAVTARLLSEISEYLDSRLDQDIKHIKGSGDLELIEHYVNVEGIVAVTFYYSISSRIT